ncbi:MAG: tetratricopeptide repeat protein [Rivularia sp. (in: cyanobacteria)]
MNKKEFSESNINSLIQIAVQKHQSGELDEAELLYKQILQIEPRSINEQEYLEKEYRPIIIGNLGNIFEQQGKLDTAVEHYQQTLQLKPDYAEAYYNLGNILQRQGKLDAAIKAYQQALKIKPEIAQAHNNLGNVLQKQGQLRVAIESYQQALKIKPEYVQAHYNLGDIFLKQGKLEAAVESFQQALKIKPDYGIAHHQLGNTFHQKGELEAAAESYQKALKFLPGSIVTDTYFNLGNTYSDQGKLEEAIETYQQALKLNPNYSPAKFGILINQLPIIYSSVAEINIQRNKYQQHLQELAQSYQTANSQQLKQAVGFVGTLQPFFLAYQGLNDRDLQQTYGEMLVHIMSNSYPQWSQDIPLPNLQPNEKIRIGFVSRFFYDHSNWKIPIKGWVENLDRSEFEFFAYHTHFNRDQNTTKAAKEFDKFTQGSRPLEEWCKLIQQDRLHLLIFPEFGMDPTTLQLGCLRLAPIQITSWGHPNTSGLPTIDYYLSSDLMEPEKAQEHYTEKLVRLPNLSINYTPLAVETEAISQKDIGIPDNEIMFWCCQSLFKYLPNHDDVFPRIAKELTNAKFVFIQHKSKYVTEVFRQRLRDAFQELGLNYQDHCIFLSRMDTQTFTSTAAVADVFLDSIGWSGCNSSLEAIAHNVPVVTLPGEMMRGRHSMAILKMMGIEETIASSKEEYVQIAIRLGRDAQYRQHISQLIAQNKHKLYNDLEPIRALEEFLFNAVGKPRKSAITTVAETLRLAIQGHRENHLEQAESAYRQVLSMQPNHPDALYGLGMVGQQQGELKEAEKLLGAAAQIQPDSVKIWFALGNLHQLQGQLPEAEDAYKQAIALRPDAVSIYNNLGYALQQQSKWSEAITCYQKALELQPNCVEADVNLGNALHTQSKLSPDKQAHYAELNHKLGLGRKKAGDLQTAEIYFQKALELNPNYGEAYTSLGDLRKSAEVQGGKSSLSANG